MSRLDFYSELKSELTREEMAATERLIIKAQHLYDNEQDDEARYALEDVVTFFKQKGNLDAANAVQHYVNRII